MTAPAPPAPDHAATPWHLEIKFRGPLYGRRIRLDVDRVKQMPHPKGDALIQLIENTNWMASCILGGDYDRDRLYQAPHAELMEFLAQTKQAVDRDAERRRC